MCCRNEGFLDAPSSAEPLTLRIAPAGTPTMREPSESSDAVPLICRDGGGGG